MQVYEDPEPTTAPASRRARQHDGPSNTTGPASRRAQYLDEPSIATGPATRRAQQRDGLRDELLSSEIFDTLAEARYLIDRWRLFYNHRRIQRALDPVNANPWIG